MGLDELEITNAGRMIFRDANGNEVGFQDMILTNSDVQQDNNQENTQISLDDMINESVDVYERRRDGESDAAYEDVDVHFNREPERMIGADFNREFTGSFTVNNVMMNTDGIDIADTRNIAISDRVTTVEERLSRFEEDMASYTANLDVELSVLEPTIAFVQGAIRSLTEYLQDVIYDVQNLQDRVGVDISQYPTLENVVRV